MSWRHRAAIFLTAALLALTLGCGRRENAAPERLVVFGIDGADWQRVVPLMREGRMPVLARLTHSGTRRTLRSLPPAPNGIEWLSPAIWTTVATGVFPERHGILNFVTPGPDGRMQPMTSNQRRTAALWDMLTARHIPVGVLGWLVTWPVEPVDGYMVSSYSPFSFQWGPDFAKNPLKGTIIPGVPHQVWPEDLEKRLQPLKVSADSVTDREITDRFLHEPVPPAPSDDAGKSLHGLRWSWASDQTYDHVYASVAANPPAGRRPLLTLLYFGSVDVVSHRFWKYMEPGTYAFGSVDPSEVTSYGQAVESAYRSVDDQIGRVVATEGDGVRMLIVSDHGFKANVDPRRMTSGWHRPQGILLAVGDGFRRGALLSEGSVVDVAPTVLYALALPVAEDFDGRPALDLFTPEYRSAHAVTSIASWEPEVARIREATPIASPVDGQILDRLRSLGYIQ